MRILIYDIWRKRDVPPPIASHDAIRYFPMIRAAAIWWLVYDFLLNKKYVLDEDIVSVYLKDADHGSGITASTSLWPVDTKGKRWNSIKVAGIFRDAVVVS